MGSMKFNLGDRVVMALTGDEGTIEGRCEYKNSTSQYYVFYKDSRGVACQEWWEEDKLSAK